MGLPTGIDFMHHKFFRIVNFSPDSSILFVDPIHDLFLIDLPRENHPLLVDVPLIIDILIFELLQADETLQL